MLVFAFCFFFFFQAEDGIRDLYVTGVQTCALPILEGFRRLHGPDVLRQVTLGALDEFEHHLSALLEGAEAFHLDRRKMGEHIGTRSEERRVGKECRSRGSPYDSKKKKRRGGE